MHKKLNKPIAYTMLLTLVLYGLSYHLSKNLLSLAALFGLISLASLACYGLRHKSLPISLPQETLLWMTVISSSVAIMLISAMIFPSASAWRHVEKMGTTAVLLLLVIPNLDQSLIKQHHLVLALLLSTLLMGSYGITDYLYYGWQHNWQSGWERYRTAGNINMQIIYACSTVSLTAIAIWVFIKELSHRRFHGLAFAASLAGLAGSTASGSRGAMLALIITVIAMLCMLLSSTRNKRFLLSISTVLISIILLTISLSNLEQRFETGYQNFHTALLDKKPEANPVAFRVQLWQSSMDIIRQHPLTGIGSGSIQAHLITAQTSQKIHDLTADFDHVHNDYLQAFSGLGIPLGLIFLLIYFYPSYFFAKKLRSCDTEGTTHNASLPAEIGLIFTLSMMVASLTDCVLLRSASFSLYLITISLLMIYCCDDKPVGTNTRTS